MSHNIEKDVCLIKKVNNFLSNSYFFVEFNLSYNESCWKDWVLSFVNLFKPSMLFISRVHIQAPSSWDIKANFPSIEGFGISMVKFFVGPSWANTTMSSNKQRTIPSHVINNVFIYAYALEHMTTPTFPLSSCQ